jgi:rhodanese-related sulfurtransferase
VILDVRTPSEISESSIPSLLGDKVILPVLYKEVSAFEGLNASQIQALGIDSTTDSVLCFCKLGGRSARAQAHLLNQGFKAVNVEGGIVAFSSYLETTIDL